MSRIYTDLAVLDITAAGVKVAETVPGLSFEALQACTAVPRRRRRRRGLRVNEHFALRA